MWIFSSRSMAGSSAPPNMCPKWKPTRKAHGLLISHVPPHPLGLVFLPLNSRQLKKPPLSTHVAVAAATAMYGGKPVFPLVAEPDPADPLPPAGPYQSKT